MIYLQLFFEFFKTGLFAIGGGLATLPFLQDMSARLGWFTLQDLADMVAVSESTPGPIGVNMATYVGFTTGGVLGGIVATLGLICPQIIVIILVATILDKFKNSRIVKAAMTGLRPASCGLIACAFVELFILVFLGGNTNLSSINLYAIVFALVLFVVMRYIPFFKKVHPIFFILFSAFVGIIFKL